MTALDRLPRLTPRTGLAVVLASVALLACDPGEPSDAGQYELEVTLGDRLGRNSQQVLVGSGFDLQLVDATGVERDSALDAVACVEATASGSLTQVATSKRGGSFEVTAAGPGAVEFAAPDLTCPDSDPLAEFGPDRWSVRGVEVEDVRGAWLLGDEGAALNWGTSPGPAGSFPPGFAVPSDGLRVVADSEFNILPVLLDRNADEAGAEFAEVRFDAREAELVVPPRWAELASSVGSDGTVRPRAHLAGRMSPNEGFTASLKLPVAEVALPPVEAVPVTEIVDLELVPVYWQAEADQNQREWGPPVGVTAIARDAEGRRVYGAPVEWSVTRGRLVLDDTTEAQDVVLVGDCKATPRRPSWRGATVEATLGDLSASAEFEWVALASDQTDPSDPLCTGSACDCSTGAPAGESALASLALLGLGLGLRRRRRIRG